MKDIFRTLSYYTSAFKDIGTHRPLFFVVLPGVIAAALIYLLYVWSVPYTDELTSWIANKYPLSFGSDLVNWIVNKFGWLLHLGIFIFIYKYILFIIMSPFMSLFSESIERKLYDYPQATNSSVTQFASDLSRGVRITIRNIWREFLLIALLFILSFIPGFQIITGPLIFLVQAYYAGFGNMDYTLERYYGVKDAASFVQSNRLMTMAHGSVFLLIMSVPILGWFLAVPLATASATRAVLSKVGPRP